MDTTEIISLSPNYEPDARKTIPIKYNDMQGNEYKTYAPIFKGGRAEEFLHFVREYLDLCDKVGYNNFEAKAKVLEYLL